MGRVGLTSWLRNEPHAPDKRRTGAGLVKKRVNIESRARFSLRTEKAFQEMRE
jgi:hypothetical protein